MENKPISIVVHEARQRIVKCINDLDISPTILEPIMRDLYIEAQKLRDEELKKDMEKFGLIDDPQSEV